MCIAEYSSLWHHIAGKVRHLSFFCDSKKGPGDLILGKAQTVLQEKLIGSILKSDALCLSHFDVCGDSPG